MKVNMFLPLFACIAVSGCSLPQATAHLVNAQAIQGGYDSPGEFPFLFIVISLNQ